MILELKFDTQFSFVNRQMFLKPLVNHHFLNFLHEKLDLSCLSPSFSHHLSPTGASRGAEDKDLLEPPWITGDVTNLPDIGDWDLGWAIHLASRLSKMS